MTSEPSRAVPEDRHAQLRVLVADANKDSRALYRESLELAGGWDVVEADDGRDALVKALVRRLSLVITETRLPTLDGFALCELLRRDSTTRTVPILVVTADTRQTDVERAHAAGADGVLIKPVTREALLNEIRRLLAGPAQAGAAAPAPRRGGTARSVDRLGRLPGDVRRKSLAKAHPRFATKTPPASPPDLLCPLCDRPLAYKRSHIGGINSHSPEQWDEYTCHASCGTFEYRQRTRKLRRVG